MRTICVIPARYGSSRFPGKPLANIAGKLMIERVYERAAAVKNIDEVYVATDDQRIETAVKKFSGNVIITDPDLPSGTDRVYQAVKEMPADVVINLQVMNRLSRQNCCRTWLMYSGI